MILCVWVNAGLNVYVSGFKKEIPRFYGHLALGVLICAALFYLFFEVIVLHDNWGLESLMYFALISTLLQIIYPIILSIYYR